MLRRMSDLTEPASPAPPEPTSLSGLDVDVEPDPQVAEEGERDGEFVQHPAKVMRIGSMTKQLLDEVRSAPLDEKSRARLKEIYETSIRELAEGLSPDLAEELANLTTPFSDDAPSESELRIVQAQLVGWLEGLFHGIQATLFAQQMAEKQIEEMRRRSLPAPAQDRSGTYL